MDHRAWLIDGTAYVFRSYYSVRPVHAPDGTPVHAALGLGMTLARLLREADPRWIAVAFDAGPTTFRNEIDPLYKANRAAPPEDLVPQFDLCRSLSEQMGLATFCQPGFEADDLLATLCRDQRGRGREVLLVSGDKDLGQLLGPRVRQYDLARGQEWGAEDLPERMGVRPEQVCDFLALMGDASDNVPGVKGVGKVAATALLARFEDLEAIYADLDAVGALPIRGAKHLAARLQRGRDDAWRSRRLVELVDDLQLGLDDATLDRRPPHPKLGEFCTRWGLPDLGRRLA